MPPRRANRRVDDRIEAIAKAVLGIVVLLALAIGGIGGFAQALMSLLVLGFMGVLVFGVCYLVLRSRLILSKRIGICLVIVGSCTGWLWYALQPPPMWREARATIRSVISPPCRADTDYSFQAQGMTWTFTRQKDWLNVDEARRYSTAAIALYFNPARPAETSDQPVNGWIRASATRHATRYHEQGDYKATIAFGAGPFSTFTGTISGPVANNRVGTAIPIWINPLNATDVSLAPRETIGGKQYPMLSCAVACAVAGFVLLFTDRRWITAVPPGASRSEAVAYVATPPTTTPLTIRRQLERIDWYQFEKVCARILERTGSIVERTGGAKPDGGADIFARQDGRTAVVQCKHWKRPIEPKVIRELQGTRTSAGIAASDAILFSLSDCTAEAKRYASDNGIAIYEADWISTTIHNLGPEHFPELSNPDLKFCPRCEAPMNLIDAATPFWGCSNFPTRRCRGKIEIA